MYRLKYLIIIGQLALTVSLKAGDLDLTALNADQVRGRLKTVLPQLTAGLEAPAILFSHPSQPKVSLAVCYNIPDFGGLADEIPILPTFGMALGVTPTITLAGQLGTGRWQGESLNSMAVFLSYFWRNPQHPEQIIGGVSHTKGPTDFHFRDVSLGYLKMFRWKYCDLSLNGTVHFTQVGIHVTDHTDPADDYRTSKKIEFGLLSVGLYRNITNHLRFGASLTFSTESASGGFIIGGYF